MVNPENAVLAKEDEAPNVVLVVEEAPKVGVAIVDPEDGVPTEEGKEKVVDPNIVADFPGVGAAEPWADDESVEGVVEDDVDAKVNDVGAPEDGSDVTEGFVPNPKAGDGLESDVIVAGLGISG